MATREFIIPFMNEQHYIREESILWRNKERAVTNEMSDVGEIHRNVLTLYLFSKLETGSASSVRQQ
jgi:hypothetical protein